LKNWQKALIITSITLTIGGIYLLVVFEQRRNPGVNSQNTQQQTESPDDVAEVRMMFPTSFDDALTLENTSVWMKNGYTMAYFPYEGGRIAFAKSLGVIPSAQRLDIKKVIKATAPAEVDDGISHGTRRFLPSSRCPAAQASTPPPSGPLTAARKSTSATFSSSTTIPTPFMTTGQRLFGRPSTRTRCLPA